MKFWIFALVSALNSPIFSMNDEGDEFSHQWGRRFSRSFPNFTENQKQELLKDFSQWDRFIEEAQRFGYNRRDDFYEKLLNQKIRIFQENSEENKQKKRQEQTLKEIQIKEWFLPYIEDFKEVGNNTKEIVDRLKTPENYHNFPINDEEKHRLSMELISELNASFNPPLVSLITDENNGVNGRNLYSYLTVVFKKQAKDRSYDHAALVIEYNNQIEENREPEFKTFLVHLASEGDANYSLGSPDVMKVKSQEKGIAFDNVVWRTGFKKNKDHTFGKDGLGDDHTAVSYFRYATFKIEQTPEVLKKIKKIERKEFQAYRHATTGSRFLVPNFPYLVSFGAPRDNCCTYVARLLEHLGIQFSKEDKPISYRDIYTFYFSAHDLRNLLGNHFSPQEGIQRELNSPQNIKSYLKEEYKGFSFLSRPNELYSAYSENSHNLLDVWVEQGKAQSQKKNFNLSSGHSSVKPLMISTIKDS